MSKRLYVWKYLDPINEKVNYKYAVEIDSQLAMTSKAYDACDAKYARAVLSEGDGIVFLINKVPESEKQSVDDFVSMQEYTDGKNGIIVSLTSDSDSFEQKMERLKKGFFQNGLSDNEYELVRSEFLK